MYSQLAPVKLYWHVEAPGSGGVKGRERLRSRRARLHVHRCGALGYEYQSGGSDAGQAVRECCLDALGLEVP